ncbi:MAG: hypothetical protein CSA36_03240 [Draconibacterium sp.]|nr:MAG: hypothetical protein CSA36_03240 [Draconibacterium sp.]
MEHKKPKIDKGVQENLFSDKKTKVLEALQHIKNQGNCLYIPLLFDMLLEASEPEIEKEVTGILETIKDKQCVNSFVRGIENEKYKPIRKKILTACWQNDLDFSTFMPVFIDVVVNDDWETGFEAFTVIENFETIPDEAIVSASVKKINAALGKANEQKKYFLDAIHKQLQE